MAQRSSEYMTLLVQTPSDAERFVSPIRRVVSLVRGGEPSSPIETLNEYLLTILTYERLATTLLIVCATIATALAAAAAHVAMSHSVLRRRREIALRLAVGASCPQIVSLVLAEGLRAVAWGGTAGIGLAFALTPVLRTAVPGVTWPTTSSVALMLVALAAVVGVAGLMPARRALAHCPCQSLLATPAAIAGVTLSAFFAHFARAAFALGFDLVRCRWPYRQTPVERRACCSNARPC